MQKKIFPKCWKISCIIPVFKSGGSVLQTHFLAYGSITSLCSFTSYASRALDNHLQVDTIYCDFSNRVRHYLSSHKLHVFGLYSDLIQLVSSYLQGKKNYVEYQGFKSRIYEPPTGVPQGSMLGPLLFSDFINDVVQSFFF